MAVAKGELPYMPRSGMCITAAETMRYDCMDGKNVMDDSASKYKANTVDLQIVLHTKHKARDV